VGEIESRPGTKTKQTAQGGTRQLCRVPKRNKIPVQNQYTKSSLFSFRNPEIQLICSSYNNQLKHAVVWAAWLSRGETADAAPINRSNTPSNRTHRGSVGSNRPVDSMLPRSAKRVWFRWWKKQIIPRSVSLFAPLCWRRTAPQDLRSDLLELQRGWLRPPKAAWLRRRLTLPRITKVPGRCWSERATFAFEARGHVMGSPAGAAGKSFEARLLL